MGKRKGPAKERRLMLKEGLEQGNFLVIGRVGMDLSPDPAGTRTRNAGTMTVGMGGSAASARQTTRNEL